MKQKLHRPRRALGLAVAAAALATLVVAAGGAMAQGANGSQSASRFARIDPALYKSDGAAGKFVPASLSNKPVTVVLQMGGAPVALRDATAKAHGQKLTSNQKAQIRQQLRAKQDALHGPLANAGAKLVGQMQDAYNGIQVTAPQKNLPQLASLPGVTGIHAVRSFKPANVNGVPFVGAPQAWGSYGLTGAGVKVASIDTGIDYTHADFGGPGTAAAWSYAQAHSTDNPAADPTLAAEFGPSSPKVKGGWDFVGDAYNANDPSSVPQPDPNPLDCFGHGSHTAGTLAGFGVLSDGSTYSGPYDANTVSGHTWNVGPGVAPQADLYAYRVFGCAGSSSVVDLAINQAVADGMDVISMSLGSDLGGTDDPTTVAAQNAVNAGVAVVASAGNAGSGAYLVGSPSTASGVLSVAAMDASVPSYPGAHMALSTGGSVDALDANGAAIPNASYPVKVLRNSDGSVSLGCDPNEYTAANVTGDVVITERGTCARVARAIYGQKAGAAAVVMINSSDAYPPFEGQITSNPDTGEAYTVTIPFLGAKSSQGAALVAADGGTVTLSSTSVANTSYQKVASFSSGGPRNPDSAPKPDVIAPGVSVASVGIGTGTGAGVESGTSMACPMTAGIAALVKQAHPSWTGLQVKAAVMNTADPSLNIGYNVRLAGTGVVQAQHAVNSSVLAQTSDQLDSIAFGYVPGSGLYQTQKAFTLTNTGSTDAIYDLSVATNGSQQGAMVGVSPTSVTVPAHGQMTVDATLSMSASAFAALPTDDTFFAGLASVGAVNSVRGDIVATPHAGDSADDQTLRLQYLLVPRGLSNVVAGAPGVWTKASGMKDRWDSSVDLTNDGIHGGTADLYSWGISDPNEGGQPMDVRDVGVQALPGAAFGVSDSDRGLVFLVNTWGQATNQSVNEFDVLIDTNHDGQPDFVVFGFDLGAVQTGSFNGQYASWTLDVSTGNIVDAFLADAPMNGSTIELPTLASDLGLSQQGGSKKQEFSYTVNAFSVVPGTFVDTTGTGRFNPFDPAVSSGDFAVVPAGGAASLPLSVHKSQLQIQSPLGWLVASVDDANGAPQAAEISAPNNKSLP
jgi:minor extracellular serine protease Vpr